MVTPPLDFTKETSTVGMIVASTRTNNSEGFLIALVAPTHVPSRLALKMEPNTSVTVLISGIRHVVVPTLVPCTSSAWEKRSMANSCGKFFSMIAADW